MKYKSMNRCYKLTHYSILAILMGASAERAHGDTTNFYGTDPSVQFGFTFNSSGSNTIPASVTSAGITPADLGNALVTAYNAVMSPTAATTPTKITINVNDTQTTGFAAAARCALYGGGKEQTNSALNAICPQGYCTCGALSEVNSSPGHGDIHPAACASGKTEALHGPMIDFIWDQAKKVSPSKTFSFPIDASVPQLKNVAIAMGNLANKAAADAADSDTSSKKSKKSKAASSTTPLSPAISALMSGNVTTVQMNGGGDCLVLLAQGMKTGSSTPAQATSQGRSSETPQVMLSKNQTKPSSKKAASSGNKSKPIKGKH